MQPRRWDKGKINEKIVEFRGKTSKKHKLGGGRLGIKDEMNLLMKLPNVFVGFLESVSWISF